MNRKSGVLLLVLLVSLCYSAKVSFRDSKPNQNNVTDAYAKIPDKGVIDVFIMPHTHDDVGWIISVDQYYVQQVQFILDSVMQQLADNPERKFTYVETAYFERWWREITPAKRDVVRSLIKKGQLEFNVGGITMNDEATTTYYEEINQMTEGHKFLLSNVDARPASVWHIDPFGHSAATASLWSQIGFSAFGLNRIPYWLKDQMKANQGLEFVWRGSKSLGKSTEIWAHVMDSHYHSPTPMAFDRNNGWDGIYVQDDPYIFNVNVKQISDNFVAMVKTRSQWYRHNKLLLPFGDDFSHREAFNSFVNMDKLIKYVNQHSHEYGVRVQYSFLSDYVNAVNALNMTWPVFEEDFFPYNDNEDAFWSGYYTSRPLIKGYLRSSDALLATAEQLAFFSRITKSVDHKAVYQSLEYLRQATSIATHHDAVTGTETVVTLLDYIARLNIGTNQTTPTVQKVASALLANQGQSPLRKEKQASNALTYAVHNPVAWSRTEFIYVLSQFKNVVVTDSTGKTVPSQVNPVPSYSFEEAPYRVFFLVDLAPLSMESYTVTPVNSESSSAHVRINSEDKIKIIEMKNATSDVVVENEYLAINMDSTTGRPSQLKNKLTGAATPFSHDYIQYTSARGQTGQASGAYIFRPETNSVYEVGSSDASKSSTLTYPFPFSSTPFFFTSPNGQNFTDALAVSVTSSSTTQVGVNVVRVDSPGGWGQDLHVDYVAWNDFPLDYYFPDQKDQARVNYAIGTANVGSSPSGQPLSVNVQFSSATKNKGSFSSSPVVFAVARNTDGSSATFVVNTNSVSSSGFTFTIKRVDQTSWSQGLVVDWFAIQGSTTSDQSATFEFTPYLYSGSTLVPRSSSASATVTVTYPTCSHNSIILPIVRSSSSSNVIAVSPRGRTSTSFTANLVSLTGSGWSQGVYIDWLVISRQPYINQVAPEVTTTIIDGPYVKEVQQQWRSGYGQTIRLYSNIPKSNGSALAGKYVEFFSEVGPIDWGQELVSKFSTGLNNQGVLYTDDNGLEIMTRRYNSTTSELIAANYFPMVSRSYIKDVKADLQVTLLSDSSHGCGSIFNGELEVMLQRRCAADDRRGVNEALDDTTKVNPRILLTFANAVDSAELHRRISVLQQWPLTIVPLAQTSSTLKTFAPLNNDLPPNVHLLTLREYDPAGNQTVVRLQHLFAVDEHPVLSKPVKIDLDQVLAPTFTIKSVVEMNLSANQPLSAVKKLTWITEDKNNKKPTHFEEVNDQQRIVILNPMEIRTFMVQY